MENILRYEKNELYDKRENLLIEIEDLKTELMEKRYEIEVIILLIYTCINFVLILLYLFFFIL